MGKTFHRSPELGSWLYTDLETLDIPRVTGEDLLTALEKLSDNA
jgi:hypothetical protein